MPAEYIDLTVDESKGHQVINLVSDDDNDTQHTGQSSSKPKRNRRRGNKPKHQDEPPKPAQSSRSRSRKQDNDARDDEHNNRRDKRKRSRSPSRRDRDHRRDRARNRSASPNRRERTEAEPRPKRKRAKSPTPFFMDFSATILPNIDLSLPAQNLPDPSGLLLPTNVKVITDADAEQHDEERQQTPLSDASFIEVLDLDPDARKTQRYFEEEQVNRAQLCSVCSQPGHFARACTMMVCQTCGAKDDHPTGLCPHSKVCFNCNQKGHVSRECPNPRARGEFRCSTCRSAVHVSNNCPSLWRTYNYLLPHERDEILQQRLLKLNIPLGTDQGGEGFIGADDWCYNCAGCGHLGDDCPQGSTRMRAGMGDRDPSAFSAINMSRGPFGLADPHETVLQLRNRSRSPPRAGPSALPANHSRPGEKARKKQADDLRKAQRRDEDRDGDDDWFSRRVNREQPRQRDQSDRGRGRDDQYHRDSGNHRSHRRRDDDSDRRGGDKHHKSRSNGRDDRDDRSYRQRGNDSQPKRHQRNGPRYGGGYS